ncbi:MAG: ribose 5-phosphate isomerase B [bacterium]|nr:ribose 5-phosphate isomerase B [bacterium]
MKIIDEKTLLALIKKGERILYLKDVRLTPAAQDLVRLHKLVIVPQDPEYHPAPFPVKSVVIGSDHGGFELKSALIPKLQQAGFSVTDVGTNSSEAVDYPDFALAVARTVAEGKAERGVMIDSIGIASAMVANKLRGIRAAPCLSIEVAKSARSHNDANVITLGGKIMQSDAAWEILLAFLQEPFSGGRHERRVKKIESAGNR